MPVIIMGLGYWDQEICDGEFKYTEVNLIWREDVETLAYFQFSFLERGFNLSLI